MLQIALLLITTVVLSHAQRGQYSYPQRPPPGGFRPQRQPPSYGPDRRPSDGLVFEGEGDRLSSESSPMEVLYSWKEIDFVFPDENMRENMIQSQQFIPRNNLILDVDVYEGGGRRRVIVSLPRVRPGVPVTLATVSQRRRRGANLLQPFPDWSVHTPGDCENGITSVFRTHVDECGRLWVLDSGNNNAFAGTNNRIVCPPQVLIYDLRNNDQLIGKYRIPTSMIADNSLLVTIAVDIRSRDCNDAFAYIADSIAYKMIVFNYQTKEFWRINSILFFPYPDFSRFTVNGLSFDLMGGIFGLALGPLFRRDRRILYFHCIDSVKQSWTDTADLRNQSMWKDNMNAKPRAFNLFNGTRPSQSAAAAMTKEGIMFFGLVNSNEIACWNSQSKFGGRNIFRLARNDNTLQFNSGIKVNGNKLYAVTNRLQNYINNQVNENEENYRVLVGDVQELTRGTKCEVPDVVFEYESERPSWYNDVLSPDDYYHSNDQSNHYDDNTSTSYSRPVTLNNHNYYPQSTSGYNNKNQGNRSYLNDGEPIVFDSSR